MLRLIGARKRDIRFMVIYQSLLLAVIGIAIGVIVGIGITGIGVNILKDSTLEIAKVKPKNPYRFRCNDKNNYNICCIYSISYNSSSYKNRKSRMYGKYIKFFKT